MGKERLTEKEEAAAKLAAFEISEQAQSSIVALNGLRQQYYNPLRPNEPFVDLSSAREIVPQVFTDQYQDRTDRFVMRAMVKGLRDNPAIFPRLESVYGNPGTIPHVTNDTFGDFINYAARFKLLTATEEAHLSRSIKTGVVAYRQLGSQEELTETEALTLLNLSKEGVFSYQAFFHCNLRLPISIAKGYKKESPDLEINDIMSHGYVGVQHAIEKFDETKGYKFSTYAMPWIRQAIQRGLALESRHIHLSIHRVTKLIKVISAKQELTKKLSRAPSTEELSEATRIEADEITALLRAERGNVTSLNKVVSSVNSEGSTELGELQEDNSTQVALEHFFDKDEVSGLFNSAELTAYERIILTMSFGINNTPLYQNSEIAERLNMPVSRVNSIKTKALQKLRSAINENEGLLTLTH